ncbi:MAG TPA: nucleotide sugar dehydrogenase [Candidatus Dormibacteraeota bacterium]|nr:nucleotide sugar dehydrogenase [Candidatus Dormibacteraeota bacterium]
MSEVAVVGLGKIGLPLAAQFAQSGKTVVGCDINPQVVATVNSGHSHIREEPGLDQAVAHAVARGRLTATTDTEAAVASADVVVIIVPVLVDREHRIDFTSLDAAARAVGAGLRKGCVVICETTVPVGTTRGRLAPILEEASHLRPGRDFRLVFSPERIYAGRVFEDLRRYPKIVGGIDAESTAKGVDFYKSVLEAEVWPVDNAETAEFSKLAETTYRDVNIALANELALYGAGRDVNVAQAFRASNSQPFSRLHQPGVGVGGHCIPVYPHFLLADAAPDELTLPRAGRRINDHMAAVALESLAKELGGVRGRRILILGVSYRENVKEMAFSNALTLVEHLHAAGANVLVHDPLFTSAELAGLEAEVADLESSHEIPVDAVIMQAFHDVYRDLDWGRFRGLRAVYDGRGVIDPETVRRAGARYLAVGTSA